MSAPWQGLGVRGTQTYGEGTISHLAPRIMPTTTHRYRKQKAQTLGLPASWDTEAKESVPPQAALLGP